MSSDDEPDFTEILELFSDGKTGAEDQLLALAYNAMRRLAASQMVKEAAGHTLDATALVHEIWVKVCRSSSVPRWPTRGHFYAYMAKSMRRHLLDYARSKKSQKAGGAYLHISLEGADEDHAASPASADLMIDLMEAIEALSVVDPDRAKVVDLEALCGLTTPEVAEVMGFSERHVRRLRRGADLWLLDRLDL